MKIEFPWPPKELSPNSTAKLLLKLRAKKVYRQLCWGMTLEPKLKAPDTRPLPLVITFYPPDRRHRDDDNMIGSFKRGRDGFANALGVDDKHFRPAYHFADPVPGGKIVVEVCQS